MVRLGTDRLIEVARRESITSYSELNGWLAEDTGRPAFDFSNPADRTAMGHLLGLIVAETRGDTGLMLSAVVHYLDQADPGPGFFRLAQNLGLLPAGAGAAARDTFLVAQLNGLYAYYRR